MIDADDFNPRSHEGCDALSTPTKSLSAISIHAATRAATLTAGTMRLSQGRFQSTQPRGLRPGGDDGFRPRVRFQSTQPRGLRPVWTTMTRTSIYFNPRSHEGCDPALLPYRNPIRLFQSTQPRGLRRRSNQSQYLASTFQSTQPRGLRQMHPRIFLIVCGISIHAATRAATRTSRRRPCLQLFQSTQPRGLRLSPFLSSQLLGYFNPRSHEGCDF